MLFLTALGLTAVGLVMNARFAASFGQTAEAALLLAAIGLAVDLLAVVLPSVGVQFWHRRSLLAAASAWTIWLAVLVLTLLAAMGFASTNIGDAVAGRARIASESALLTERIGQLRRERAGISEMRPVGGIEIELQKAQTEAQAVWRITDGCRDVTRPASARACAPVLELRQAHATAARRDAIDTELRDLQAKRAALPAVATADPQATTAAEVVTWLSAGTFNPAADDVARLRALGLALMPSLAGLIGMLAMSLTRRGLISSQPLQRADRNTRDRDTSPAPAACRPRCRACRRAAAARCGSLRESNRASAAKPFWSSASLSDSATISGGIFRRAATIAINAARFLGSSAQRMPSTLAWM